MKNKISLLLLSLFIVGIIVFQSCKKKEDDAAPVSKEYVANDATFSGFKNWFQFPLINGKDPNHGVDVADIFRYIYLKDDKDTLKGGEYPKGTLLVKNITDLSNKTIAVVAMSKRGGGYNTTQNDWEFFELNANGSIKVDSTGAQIRGAVLADKCGGCHIKAKVDFVYSKYN